MSPVFAEAAHLWIGLSLGLLALLAGAETAWPRRVRTQPRLRRWPGNLGIALVDALTMAAACGLKPDDFRSNHGRDPL